MIIGQTDTGTAMQARYYLGCAMFVLGLAGIMLGDGGFGDDYFYLGIGLCAAGFILIMTSKRKHKTSEQGLRSGSDPHRVKRRRDATRRKDRRDSGDGRHENDDGDGGDGD